MSRSRSGSLRRRRRFGWIHDSVRRWVTEWVDTRLGASAGDGIEFRIPPSKISVGREVVRVV